MRNNLFVNTKNADRMLSAVDALLTRYLLAGADGEPRPMRYNPLDYQTLKFIENHPNSRATDISHALHLPPTSLQSALDRLIKLDLIEKGKHPSDGRAKVYQLTETGQIMRNRIHSQDRANMDEMLSSISGAEREAFLSTMEKIERFLREAM